VSSRISLQKIGFILAKETRLVQSAARLTGNCDRPSALEVSSGDAYDEKPDEKRPTSRRST
jgi:hypothetical protein